MWEYIAQLHPASQVAAVIMLGLVGIVLIVCLFRA